MLPNPEDPMAAWSTQTVAEVRSWMQRIEGKLDRHIEEGQQVKTDIAVLRNDHIDPAKVAVLESRVNNLTWMVRGAIGTAVTALIAVVLKYLGV